MRKRLTEKQLETREAATRETLGLEGAMRGDEEGVRRLAYFFEGEVSNIAFFSSLPEPVKMRLNIVRDELRALKHFMDGRASALPKPKKP